MFSVSYLVSVAHLQILKYMSSGRYLQYIWHFAIQYKIHLNVFMKR